MWYDILKTKFVFEPDNPEVAHFDRNTKEVTVNLSNPDAKESMNLSEDDFIEQLTEVLTEEYTHLAIDDEIVEAWKTWMETEGASLSVEDMIAQGHVMHEIGANAARGYSPLGTWLMVYNHGNVNHRFRVWVMQNKILPALTPELVQPIIQSYNKLKLETPDQSVRVEDIIELTEREYGGIIRNALV